MNGKDKVQGDHSLKNDCLEMASEKTDPERLTCPLDTNKFITVNYSTNTLKYIPHAQQTSVQKSQRAKTKGSLINGCLVLYILFVMF